MAKNCKVLALLLEKNAIFYCSLCPLLFNSALKHSNITTLDGEK